jgi:hypothetical protein
MQIKGVIPHGNHLVAVDIFGHTSKGMAGLELVGLGTLGRTIKEKLVFISKCEQFKFPLLRFLICVELQEEVKEYRSAHLRYLELPLLLLFWSLVGHLPIGRLDDCFTQGRISPTGDVTQLQLNREEFIKLSSHSGIEMETINKYLGINDHDLPDSIYHLPLQEILPDHDTKRQYSIELRKRSKSERLKVVADT